MILEKQRTPTPQNRSFCITGNYETSAKDASETHCGKKCACDEKVENERIDLLYDPQSLRRLSQTYVSTVERSIAQSQYKYTLDNVVYAEPNVTPIPPVRTSINKQVCDFLELDNIVNYENMDFA